MIKLILIIIIIFFINKIIFKENFDGVFVDDNKCNFYPYGNNLDDCNTKCIEFGYSNVYDKYDKCIEDTKCKEKCRTCQNKELCPWTVNNNDDDIDSDSDSDNDDIQEILVLKEETSDDNFQILLEWGEPEYNEKYTYLIYYKNELNKALNVITHNKPQSLSTTQSLSTKSTSSNIIQKKKIFNIIDYDNYQFNDDSLIKNNIYEFIIYGIIKNKNGNDDDIIKSNKITVYT